MLNGSTGSISNIKGIYIYIHVDSFEVWLNHDINIYNYNSELYTCLSVSYNIATDIIILMCCISELRFKFSL